MSRIDHLTHVFFCEIPGKLRPGVLYVSYRYRTAIHLCACGCGIEVVTPLRPSGWRLSVRKRKATLSPSIGNWSLPCKSHYFVERGRILWSYAFTAEEIDVARRADFHSAVGLPSRSHRW